MAKTGKKRRAGRIALLICAAVLLVFAAWTVWGNLTVGVSRYELGSPGLPEAFDGFTIAHVSDLHNAEFGENNSRLVELLRERQPDIIVITGDLVDMARTYLDVAAELIWQMTELAPCYYVSGNHEAALGKAYAELERCLLNAGVCVLRDEAAEIERDGASIRLIGLEDPDFTSRDAELQMSITNEKLRALGPDDGFTLLLSHRPELFDAYAAAGVELALCGHAHGGQFRLPFVGGVYAPDQGFFPEYDGGLYRQGDAAMIVSRGLGNSAFPVRVNNRPELVTVELQGLDE